MGTVMHPLQCVAASIAFMLWLAVDANSAQAAEPLEYSVKAAYLAKFPFYVDWPPLAFSSPTSPIVLCVVGEDPFGPLLEEATHDQQSQGRPLVVRRIKTLSRDSGCHVAYVGADSVRFDLLKGSPVLVVTDTQGGNGVINFVLRDNRVRFTVDDDTAAQHGLGISSKLLNVALAVKPRGPR
jgi:hypothetical protein